MRKCIAAIIILLLIFAAGLFNIHCIDTLTRELIDLTEAAQRSARADDLPASVAAVEQAAKSWEDAAVYTHIFIRHTEVDATTDAFCELLAELYAGNADGAQGMFRKLRARLTLLADMERISFGSVF